MNPQNWYQYLCPGTEMLKPVTFPLPSTGKQISVMAEGEAKAEWHILKTASSFNKRAGV